MEREDLDPAELLKHHRQLTSRLARRYGRFDAEDLASEALARSLRRPAPEGAHQPWLERIVRNLVVDRARRSSRAAAHAITFAGTTDGTAPSPEEHLLLDERRRAVQEALPAMPSGLRDAVVGRFYEERDYDAVASARGISPATARTRVHRALASLRVSLGRLRAAIPLPQLFSPHSFGATTALLPAAFSAALVVPSLGATPVSSPQVRTVLIAQAAPRTHAPRPSLESLPRPQPSAESSPVAKAPPSGSAPRPVASSPPSEQRPAATDDRPVAVKRIDYDDDMVEGDLARPDGILVDGDPRTQHSSLIEIRREFVAEIAKMLEDF